MIRTAGQSCILGPGLGLPGVYGAMSLMEHGVPWNFSGFLQVPVVFWIGFALPIGHVLSPARPVLALVAAPAQRPCAHA